MQLRDPSTQRGPGAQRTTLRPGRWLPGLLLLLLLLTTPGRAAAEPFVVSPTGWPLSGAAQVLRPFDPPSSPWGRGHRGVDLRARVGEEVLATAAGTVTFAGRIAGRGVVVVDHGRLRTTYEPVTGSVSVGTQVGVGEMIGRLAPGTHCGTTPCLHWGLLKGKTYLDPLGPAGGPELVGSGVIELLPATSRAVAEGRAAQRAAAARALAAVALTDNAMASGNHGFLRPVPGGITSAFGRRFHPTLHVWKLHDGTDIGAACGTPIRAPFAGVVTRAYYSPAYGHRLFLDHGEVGGRRVRTSYNHANNYIVGVGSKVSRGQVIGRVGSTGYATGCHLHLMVWLDGRLTNPMTWW